MATISGVSATGIRD